jgi:hypothetical protein
MMVARKMEPIEEVQWMEIVSIIAIALLPCAIWLFEIKQFLQWVRLLF